MVISSPGLGACCLGHTRAICVGITEACRHRLHSGPTWLHCFNSGSFEWYRKVSHIAGCNCQHYLLRTLTAAISPFNQHGRRGLGPAVLESQRWSTWLLSCVCGCRSQGQAQGPPVLLSPPRLLAHWAAEMIGTLTCIARMMIADSSGCMTPLCALRLVDRANAVNKIQSWAVGCDSPCQHGMISLGQQTRLFLQHRDVAAVMLFDNMTATICANLCKLFLSAVGPHQKMALAHMKSSKVACWFAAPAVLSRSLHAGSRRFHCCTRCHFCNLREHMSVMKQHARTCCPMQLHNIPFACEIDTSRHGPLHQAVIPTFNH